jgi:dTDP-4-amino-4,6-dideoxygalactose transaminase
VKQRRAVYQWYQEYFQNINRTNGYHVVLQPEAVGSISNRWLTAILIDPEQNKEITREQLRLALEQENIESRPLWKPMHLQPVFEYALFFGDGTSERLFEHGLCLPSGSNMTEKDMLRIKKILDKVFG